MVLTLIGYWKSEADTTLPDPADFVDALWDESERDTVSQYLAGGTITRTSLGFSSCRLCGVQNGSVEYSDGTYLWPQGLGHYVEEHAVRLPDEVVRHATTRLQELEDGGTSLTRWRAMTRRDA
jgi:hypothetical protein